MQTTFDTMKAIEVNSLSKKYIIKHQSERQASSLRDSINNIFRKQPPPSEGLSDTASTTEKEEFWALKDITFDIEEGERIAIIGGNGAGKSTLLKILSKITEPTSGTIKIRGKVASLLEVGTGFHPELSGRENIFLNGAILGMRRSEIAAKFDTIVAFSGVEKFIDTPVKHYSSGMYVRLAFSVSAWLDPDILIVDEVLSVGDQAFQQRCAERMKELTGAGRTVLFVSHSMQAVKSMCEKAIYLNKGKVISFGSVDEASKQYLRNISLDSTNEWVKPSFTPENAKSTTHFNNQEKIKCHSAKILNSKKQICGTLPINQLFFIDLKYEVLSDLNYPATPNIHFYDEFGSRFFISLPEKTCPRSKGSYTARCEIPPYLFNNGRFSVMIAISSFSIEAPVHFSYESALRFEVLEPNMTDPRRHGWQGDLPGLSRPRLNWKFDHSN